MINLLGNVVFTDAQILKRTEAMIRGKYPWDLEAVINRKATGVSLGQYTMTAEEQAELADYMATCNAAKAIGDQAKIDNEKLKAVIAYEKALARLAKVELSVGRAEQVAVDEVTETDEMGIVTVITEAVPYIAPTEPIATTIEVTDIDGNVSVVPNPIVVTDEAERAEAQAAVDAVTVDTLSLFQSRNV